VLPGRGGAGRPGRRGRADPAADGGRTRRGRRRGCGPPLAVLARRAYLPATLSYTTSLGDVETAHRAGISADYRCAAALDAALAGLARRAGCRAGVRASYADQLQGVIYTVGVLAFHSPGQARVFARAAARSLPSGRPPAAALRALALPGTASARFTDSARQAATAHWDGPYVLLTVAGYADGRPATATGQYDGRAFDAAGELATAVLTPLGRPAAVNCASRQWAC
jgi:hypothetical protein